MVLEACNASDPVTLVELVLLVRLVIVLYIPLSLSISLSLFLLPLTRAPIQSIRTREAKQVNEGSWG